MGGLVGASGALYLVDSSRPGVFPARSSAACEARCQARLAFGGEEHERQRKDGQVVHRRVPVKQGADFQIGGLSSPRRAASVNLGRSWCRLRSQGRR
jgi:hypothetical protein